MVRTGVRPLHAPTQLWNPCKLQRPLVLAAIVVVAALILVNAVYVAAEFAAGVLAAFAYVAISRTRADETPAAVAVPTQSTTAA